MKSIFLGDRSLNTDLATLLLRFLFGGLFIFHGWMKFDMYDVYQPMTQDIIGIGRQLTYDLPMIAEFVGGILIVLGFLTRLAVIPIAVTMAVAYYVAHGKDQFVMKELPFVFLYLSPVVFILGSGRYSLDHLIFRNKFSKYANS